MIGTLLNNRYRIETTLSEGGMGVVYKAHDTLPNCLEAQPSRIPFPLRRR